MIAGLVSLRPILVTSATTVIGGLTASVLLMLLVVHSVYVVLDRRA